MTKIKEVKKPWGAYQILKKTKTEWVKRLHVKKGFRLSLQAHLLRNEIWIVESGTILAQIGSKSKTLKKGDIAIIPKNKKHRITALSDAIIIEIAYGKVFETDITRYEDDFGRC